MICSKHWTAIYDKTLVVNSSQIIFHLPQITVNWNVLQQKQKLRGKIRGNTKIRGKTHPGRPNQGVHNKPKAVRITVFTYSKT